jgi:2-polyprenyl-6-hydroxyphenyl methylase/3-demethylubiquinone-9 3-methyltransferase
MPQTRGADRTVDPAEVAHFDKMARDWWDPKGPMRALMRMNPVRLAFIRDQVAGHFGRDPKSIRSLEGLAALDIGCGGGLLSEPLARLGAKVTGLDPAAANIAVARQHAERAGLAIDYRAETVEAVAQRGESFDLVLALEVIEHVADTGAFTAAAAAVTKPGGLLVMSTINRTMKSFALAIVGAEYVLRLLPRGTHDWEKFLKPSELARLLAAAGLEVGGRRGIVFNPLANTWRLSSDTGVNYFITATRLPSV